MKGGGKRSAQPGAKPPGRSAEREILPEEGLEPTHCCQYRILSPARLPVPPPRRGRESIVPAQKGKVQRYGGVSSNRECAKFQRMDKGLSSSVVFLLLLSGCSTSTPQPPPPHSSVQASEVFLSRGSLTGTSFEQYKLTAGQLYYECGTMNRNRYAASEQDLLQLSPEAEGAIQDLARSFDTLFGQPPPRLDPPGNSNGVFDPGQASFVVSNGKETREIRTSLDTIANASSPLPGRLKRFVMALRGAVPKEPCGSSAFFGLGREQ